MSSVLRAWIIGLIACNVCAAAPAYFFEKITDSNGPLKNFSSGGAAINSDGVVGFMGTLADNDNGIFRSFGGSITTIAVAGGSLSNAFAGSPSINDAGTVAFYNGFVGGPGGVFSGGGGRITTIASTTGAFSDFDPVTYPAINASGAVVFSATLRTGGNGIFVGSGGAITTIALGSGTDSFGFIPSINAHGTCAFVANSGTIQTVYTGNGGPLTTIADNTGTLSRFGIGVGINDAGTVALSASFDTGENAILVSNGAGQFITLADSSGNYDNLLSVPSINNAGTVAFYAMLDGGGEGVFTGPDPINDKVIRSGDVLFGSTVAYVGFLRGLNDNGDVAFVYELTNGDLGIAVATVPEPSTCAMLLSAALIQRRRRRVAALRESSIVAD